ncbi:MAG: MFS transporter [Thiobacillus sp.]|nr:MFS transporter [Thiobacillus sp.]
MSSDRRRIVGTIMVCHFIAAFAALGMPPFFALILDRSLHSDAAYLAGWLYVVPTFFTALSSPWWGRLADRYGTRPLLIRAQLGLSASFLLAGFAPNAGVFFLALSLQGLLGGTFGASNAYLATVVSGPALSHGLTLMQWSARAALVVAPAAIGLLMVMDSPLELYRYLALLPLGAALLIGRLPAHRGGAAVAPSKQFTPSESRHTPAQIFALQFVFVFATVVSFPYFVPFVLAGSSALTPAVAGLLFGAPHLVYLVAAVPLNRWLAQRDLRSVLLVAYLLIGIALFGQLRFPTLPDIAVWRVVMGTGMTLGFIGLHALIAGTVQRDSAGRTFGWFESSSKWGAVVAGVTAGTLAQALGLGAPFVIGALTMLAAACYLLALRFQRSPLRNS